MGEDQKIFFEYFRVRGLMPRALFDQSKASEAKIKAHVYGMQQAMNRLGKAVDKTIDKRPTKTGTRSGSRFRMFWKEVRR